MTHSKRRRILQAAMGLPFIHWHAAWAQNRTLFAAPRPPSAGGPSGQSLLTAPRRALVIGNSSYAVGPLKNPANDAKAISEELRRQGFEVATGLDLKRDEMTNMVNAYAQSLARSKPVALFYFAGHGLQLAWRNYLVPVDAQVKTAADVRAQCVDVNSVIDGIGKAANPMNMIILDACRDDPFGRSEQKGLSQLDAPPGTLLAYATSPGNVASDGDGANGLYTENLLREMKVPEAKIEDVFKRVRLAVRRRSHGQQIPWESTSLEEDFWFIPPKELKRMAEREAERLYQEELALWERAEKAKDPGPIEDYLRRYPSGRFSELAQLQLDRVLAAQGERKIEVVSAPENPYTQGSASLDTRYRVGDSYTYNFLDPYSKVVQDSSTWTITQITDTEVLYDDGRVVTDLLGNPRRLHDGRTFGPNQIAPRDFSVGKRWSSRFTGSSPKGGAYSAEFNMRIVGKERVSIPAGTFDAFRLEVRGDVNQPAGHVGIELTAWYAPEKVRRYIARHELRRFNGREVFAERQELAKFQQS
jgi:hypothetical protein